MLGSMKSRVLGVLLLLTACSDDPVAAPVSQTDVVGVLELPMSHRSMPQAPPGAGLIEVSPTELRYEHAQVLTLEHGQPPAAEVRGELLPKLQQAVSAARHNTMILRLHVLTPMATLREILATLNALNISDVVFAIRPVASSTSVGWLDVRAISLMPPSEEPSAIPGAAVIPWDEFTRAWGSVTNACRRDQRAECAAPSPNPATGGSTNIVLRTRGDGIKVEFTQYGAPAAAPAAPRVEMIEGVAPSAAPVAAEPEDAPIADAHYTFRVASATASPSALSGMFNPLCGSRSCGVTVISDPETSVMNAISALGAAFPAGAQAPYVVLRSTR